MYRKIHPRGKLFDDRVMGNHGSIFSRFNSQVITTLLPNCQRERGFIALVSGVPFNWYNVCIKNFTI